MAYRQRSYFYECPYCGAALDPGETCDCRMTAEQGTDPGPGAGGTDPGSMRMQPARGKRMHLAYETGGQMRMETA